MDTIEAQEFTGTIRDATLTQIGDSPYEHWLVGKIYNDIKKRFPDGSMMHTSIVEVINFKEGWAKTKNSLYKLEEDKSNG